MIRLTDGCYRRLMTDRAGVCTVCHYIADDAAAHVAMPCHHCGSNAVFSVTMAHHMGLLRLVNEGHQNVDDAGPRKVLS